MDMPKPTEAHRRLAALAGRWSGEEILHPAPWQPERRTALGHFDNRVGIDGMFLINDYREERDGQVIFRGHGVYGWDAERERYTMYWFDSAGVPPRQILGRWQGETLTFEAEGPSVRYVYTVPGADRFTFRIERLVEGERWEPVLEGDYRRAGA
jgi:hypothetical protein